MNAYIIPVLLAFLLGMFCGFKWAAVDELLSNPEEKRAIVETSPVPELPVESQEEFPVAGRRRKPTWRERKRELETAARTKRQKREEWRD